MTGVRRLRHVVIVGVAVRQDAMQHVAQVDRIARPLVTPTEAHIVC